MGACSIDGLLQGFARREQGWRVPQLGRLCADGPCQGVETRDRPRRPGDPSPGNGSGSFSPALFAVKLLGYNRICIMFVSPRGCVPRRLIFLLDVEQ